MDDMTFVAEFPTTAYAKTFADRITTDNFYATEVVHKGRKVTWVVDLPDTYNEGIRVYEEDMLGTVGYYGSTQQRKAKLNGRPAPISY